MSERELAVKRSFVLNNGYRIYPIVHGYGCYKLVMAKATKYNWSDIPKENRKNYEEIDKVIYKLKIGDIIYKENPKDKDEKWWDKITELYESIYKNLITKNQ